MALLPWVAKPTTLEGIGQPRTARRQGTGWILVKSQRTWSAGVRRAVQGMETAEEAEIWISGSLRIVFVENSNFIR